MRSLELPLQLAGLQVEGGERIDEGLLFGRARNADLVRRGVTERDIGETESFVRCELRPRDDRIRLVMLAGSKRSRVVRLACVETASASPGS
ncbi:hypothetical protein D3C80_2050710 [compost metagenome]